MAGVYMSSGDPNYRPLGEGAELNNVLRAALVSAQRLLRERFENRVAWVDGHWQWRREKTGADAAPLPAEARKKINDVGRLFEILTNAQFRDRTQHAAKHEPVTPVTPPPEPRPFQSLHRIFGPDLYESPKPRGDDSPFVICVLLLVATVIVWASAAVFLSQDSNRRRIKQLRQRIRGWFSKKAAAANEQVDAEPAPPRDDPPPPYSDGSAEPFLSPAGARGNSLAGGDLPPPYSSCDTQPDCKQSPIYDQLQNLLDGGTSNNVSEVRDGGAGATDSDACEVGGITDESSANSGREKVSGDTSRVVVV